VEGVTAVVLQKLVIRGEDFAAAPLGELLGEGPDIPAGDQALDLPTGSLREPIREGGDLVARLSNSAVLDLGDDEDAAHP